MECVLSGNQIKTLNRAIICMSKIGNELLIDAQTEKLTFRTLNSSRSSFLSITFKPQFFDGYTLSEPVMQCSVLLKSVCTVFRTPPGNIDRLAVILPNQDANKLQWTLECHNGMRKTYWISCNAEDDMQDVVVPRESLSSHLVVKPRDLNRLLSNFQSSLSEITLIATEPVSTPNGSETPEAKAVELRSYFDTVKEGTEDTLHTQLWIDPAEELKEYSHFGDAVDVTFSMKELKAFLVFCEGSEADMHLFFEKAGHPVLVAPRFGLDDAAHADFDATLVLATVQGSQIRSADGSAEAQPVNGSQQAAGRNLTSTQAQRRNNRSTGSTPVSLPDSDHTVIWSELTGSAARSQVRGGAARTELAGPGHSLDASEEIGFRYHRQQPNQASGRSSPATRAVPPENEIRFPNQAENNSTERQRFYERRGTAQQSNHGDTGRGPSEIPARDTSEQRANAAQQAPAATTTRGPPPGESQPVTQGQGATMSKNLRNWVSGDLEDDEDDDDDDSNEGVQSTPPHRRGLH